MKIDLNAIIDPYDARVVATTAADGSVAEAHFDLAGLPRVDHLLEGKSAAEAVYMAEHLCGICPAAHHLAGVRALDHLAPRPVPHTAATVRRILHAASHIDQHSLRFAAINRETAVQLRKFAKNTMAAVGSPGHFPTTAVPGGVAYMPSREQVTQLQENCVEILHRMRAVCDIALTTISGEPVVTNSATLAAAEPGRQLNEPYRDEFLGINVALVDSQGHPDLLGSHVKAVHANGELVFCEPAEHWGELVREAYPGAAAPQPYIAQLGSEQGRYRVGPIAQLSVGELLTPEAAAMQEQWLADPRQSLGARAVIALHCVEDIACAAQELAEAYAQGKPEDRPLPTEEAGPLRAGTATGLVDSPRGILAHTYTLDDKETVQTATVLTPTAQNEPWLADLLRTALSRASAESQEQALEDSIREADPCLPISSAPAGTMKLRIDMS
ncbi:MAG: nickel-dependent hydrogenase large subunit [Arcanobacterium sp.]|nr:nickel-dependent hydrogenase large subunit [Arcanobacterium sp.]MDY5588819.1 nickel-dependent hydrogenase large subunit [Arcanobacterium sp.]